MEEEEVIVKTLYQGCTVEAAIAIGQEKVTSQDIWDLPERHDLNTGKGHYLIPTMHPDGQGGIRTALYAGSAWALGTRRSDRPLDNEFHESLDICEQYRFAIKLLI